MKYYLTEPVTRHEILRDKERLVAEVEVDGETYYLKGEKTQSCIYRKHLSFTKIMSEAGLPFIVPEKTMNGNRYIEHEGLFSFWNAKGTARR